MKGGEDMDKQKSGSRVVKINVNGIHVLVKRKCS